MKRKLLCGLLAMVMCLSLLPGAAWAEDTDTAEPQPTESVQPEDKPAATEPPLATPAQTEQPVHGAEQPAAQPSEQPAPPAEPESETGGAVPPAPETPVCSCTAPCAEGSVNAECPICGAEGAAVEQCGMYAPVVLAAAANGSTEVKNEKELGDALKKDSVTDIVIKTDVSYTGSINAPAKKITVSSGCTFTWGGYSATFSVGTLTIEQGASFATTTRDWLDKRTVSGSIVNNGTIYVSCSSGSCLWNASTSGGGQMQTAGNVYVKYGRVPQGMLKGAAGKDYSINITEDEAVCPSVTLRADMKVGENVNPTFNNIVSGVDLSDVFDFKWTLNSSSTYSTDPNPLLTSSGTLKLTVQIKAPYCMRSSSGTYSISDATAQVAAAAFDTVYVSVTGDKNALGKDEAAPVDTLREALKRVSDGGTIILLSDISAGNVIYSKNVTIKSNAEKAFTLGSGGGSPIDINSGKTLTLDNVAFSDGSLIKPNTGASACTLKLQNCGASGRISVQGIQMVQLNNSVINGTVTDAESITLGGNAGINGSFSTNDLNATGEGNRVTIQGTNATVTGSITADKPITLVPGKLERGEKLIKVPKGSAEDIVNKFELSDDENGKFALKCRTPNNGNDTYIGISRRIESVEVKLAVLNEPALGKTVAAGADGKDEDVHRQPDTLFYVGDNNSGGVWSGYNNADKKWAAGDEPKLTLDLYATIPSNDDDFRHFDGTFDPSDVKVYTWIADVNTTFIDANRRADVTVAFAENGKVSDDGRKLSIVLTYPKITKAAQTVTLDTADASLGCRETLTRTGSCTSGAALTYTSSDPAVASVDRTTGVVTALKPGTATITASAPETDEYTAAAASYTVTVSHKFAGAWQSDANEHWKLCACGEKGEKAAHTGGTATCANKAKCEVCGAEYGALDPKNHSDLRHVPARGATYLADGNIEYWYCAGCTRYYLDAAATRETTLAATVIPRLRWYDWRNPRTGDEAELALPLALFIASAAVASAAALLLIRKRAPRNGKQKD